MIYIGSFFFKTGSAVSGADEDAVDRGGRCKFPDESMFTAAAADDEPRPAAEHRVVLVCGDVPQERLADADDISVRAAVHPLEAGWRRGIWLVADVHGVAGAHGAALWRQLIQM